MLDFARNCHQMAKGEEMLLVGLGPFRMSTVLLILLIVLDPGWMGTRGLVR
jgi:hypothetical protein